MAKVVAGIAADLILRIQKWINGFKKARKEYNGFRGDVKQGTASLVKWLSLIHI